MSKTDQHRSGHVTCATCYSVRTAHLPFFTDEIASKSADGRCCLSFCHSQTPSFTWRRQPTPVDWSGDWWLVAKAPPYTLSTNASGAQCQFITWHCRQYVILPRLFLRAVWVGNQQGDQSWDGPPCWLLLARGDRDAVDASQNAAMRCHF